MAKRDVIHTMTRLRTERAGMPAADILIAMQEPPQENRGCYGTHGSNQRIVDPKE